MEKIDWAGLIKLPKNEVELVRNGQKSSKSRNNSNTFDADAEKSAKQKASSNNDFIDSSRINRLFRAEKHEKGMDDENFHATDKNSTEKSRVANLHPIAVCLLMNVGRKLQCSDEKLFNELVKLKNLEPSEQIRRWASYAVENELNPLSIVYPFARSAGRGSDCMRCQHIDMRTAHQPGSRRLFHWSCKKHHSILEGYRGLERVLIAPETCNDYKTST